MNFGETLRALRLGAGLTQVELSVKCGVSLSAIRQYEQDHKEPALRSAVRIADVLGVSLDELAGRTRAPEGEPAKARKAKRKGGGK
jgi:transcriptional regulator with XRE-family HTH domain